MLFAEAIFAPDGRSILLHGTDARAGRREEHPDRVELWQIKTRRRLWRFLHPPDGLEQRYSPDGKLLAVSGGTVDPTLDDERRDGAIQLLNPSSGKLLRELPDHTFPVWSMDFGPGSDTLVSASIDQTVRLWRLSSAESSVVVCGKSETGLVINDVAISPDGKWLVIVGSRKHDAGETGKGQILGTVRVIELPSGELARAESHPFILDQADFIGDKLITSAFSPRDEGQTAAPAVQGEISFWNVPLLRRESTFSFPKPVTDIAVSPDGRLLAADVGSDESAKDSDRLCVWELPATDSR